jgi:hypothetical protein
MRCKVRKLGVFVFLGFVMAVSGHGQDFNPAPQFADWPKLTSGIISNINLAKRTVSINAVRYLLPSATAANPLRVRMFGTDYGSIELLKNGMTVSVSYEMSGKSRAAIEIVELERSSET